MHCCSAMEISHVGDVDVLSTCVHRTISPNPAAVTLIVNYQSTVPVAGVEVTPWRKLESYFRVFQIQSALCLIIMSTDSWAWAVDALWTCESIWEAGWESSCGPGHSTPCKMTSWRNAMWWYSMAGSHLTCCEIPEIMHLRSFWGLTCPKRKDASSLRLYISENFGGTKPPFRDEDERRNLLSASGRLSAASSAPSPRSVSSVTGCLLMQGREGATWPPCRAPKLRLRECCWESDPETEDPSEHSAWRDFNSSCRPKSGIIPGLETRARDCPAAFLCQILIDFKNSFYFQKKWYYCTVRNDWSLKKRNIMLCISAYLKC